jgi:hypothetical protein
MRTFACFWRVFLPSLRSSVFLPVLELDTHSEKLNKRKGGNRELLVCEAKDKTKGRHRHILHTLFDLVARNISFVIQSFVFCRTVLSSRRSYALLFEWLGSATGGRGDCQAPVRQNVLLVGVPKERKEQDNFTSRIKMCFSRNRFPFVCNTSVEWILLYVCIFNPYFYSGWCVTCNDSR